MDWASQFWSRIKSWGWAPHSPGYCLIRDTGLRCFVIFPTEAVLDPTGGGYATVEPNRNQFG